MAGSTEMTLVFRLDGVGFSLSVKLLGEIVQLEKMPRVSRKKDAPPWPLAEFRDETIPVVDLGQYFGVSSTVKDDDLTMLVLHGELGYWGAMVSMIEGVRPNAEFEELTLSPLFSLGGAAHYDKIDVWRGEPLIRLDPDRFAPQGDQA